GLVRFLCRDFSRFAIVAGSVLGEHRDRRDGSRRQSRNQQGGKESLNHSEPPELNNDTETGIPVPVPAQGLVGPVRRRTRRWQSPASERQRERVRKMLGETLAVPSAYWQLDTGMTQ